jgi:hypothetical protein
MSNPYEDTDGYDAQRNTSHRHTKKHTRHTFKSFDPAAMAKRIYGSDGQGPVSASRVKYNTLEGAIGSKDFWYASAPIIAGNKSGSYAFEGPYSTEEQAMEALDGIEGLGDVTADAFSTRDKVKAKIAWRTLMKNRTKNIVDTFARRYSSNTLRKAQ